MRADEPLAQRAAPALEWLAGEERRQAEQSKRKRAIAAIENALEEVAPKEELERLYQAVLVFDEPIPPALKHRVEQRLAGQALATQRRHRIILAGVVSAVVFVGALIAYVIVEQGRRTTVAGVADSLQGMIDQGQLDEAQAFYEQVTTATPSIAARPEVQSEKSRLTDALGAQTNRRQAFARSLAQAQAAPPTNPDQMALSEARRLAELPEEKQGVAEVESQIAAATRKTQQEHDTSISERLADIRERLKAIEAVGRKGQQEDGDKLPTLLGDIESARKQFAKANPAVLAQLNPLAARIKAIQKANEQENQRSRALAAVTAAIGNQAAFQSALSEYAKQFPDTEIAANIALLNQDSKNSAGFVAWCSFVSDLFRNLDSVSPTKARELIVTGDQLVKNYPSSHLADAFRTRRAQLESISNREPVDGRPIVEELHKLLRDPLVGKLWMVERNDGLRFYCLKEPPPVENGSVRFDFLAGFDLAEKPQSIRKSDVSYLGRAPQSTIAARAMELLGAVPSRDWEKNFTSVLNTITNDQRLDSVLKLTLLQRVLKIAATGSAAINDGFADFRRELESANVDTSVTWMDPRDSTAQGERKRADVFLQGLPAITKATLATAENVRRFRAPVDFDYRCIGWLNHDANGSWIIVAKDQTKEDGDLIVVSKTMNNTTVAPIVIGRIEQGAVRLDGGSSSGLLVGRPVFLRAKLIRSNQ
ncbi:MAG: hypothetical protein WD468_09115 [Pirellulales bacterium]